MIPDHGKAVRALSQIIEGAYTLRSMNFIEENHVDQVQRLASYVINQLRVDEPPDIQIKLKAGP